MREARRSLARPASLYGIKLTFLPILIKAASLALGNFPGLNARVEGGGEALTIFPHHNIGVAMDTPKAITSRPWWRTLTCGGST